jgi:hypothetical protein
MIFGTMPMPALAFETAPHYQFLAFLFFMSIYLFAVIEIKQFVTHWLGANARRCSGS